MMSRAWPWTRKPKPRPPTPLPAQEPGPPGFLAIQRSIAESKALADRLEAEEQIVRRQP